MGGIPWAIIARVWAPHSVVVIDGLARTLCPVLVKSGGRLWKRSDSERPCIRGARTIATAGTEPSNPKELPVPLLETSNGQQNTLDGSPASLAHISPPTSQTTQPAVKQQTKSPASPPKKCAAKSKLKKPPPLPPSTITTQLSDEHTTIFAPVINAILHRQYPSVFQIATQIIKAHPDLLHSAATYSLLIEACSLFPGSLMQEIAWSLFTEMQSRKIRPTSSVYHHLLRLLANSPDYLKRTQVLRDMKARWFTVSDEGWGWVIQGLLKDGQFEAAVEVVEKQVNEGKGLGRDTWEKLVIGLARAGEIEEAWRWMVVGRREIWARWEAGEDVEGGEMGNGAWYELCTEAARALHKDATLWSWRYILTLNLFPPDDGLLHLILDVATRYSLPSVAAQVLRFLSARDVAFTESHFQALIELYLMPSPTNTPNLHKALSVLQLMRKSGVPTTNSTVKAMAACFWNWDDTRLNRVVAEAKMWLDKGDSSLIDEAENSTNSTEGEKRGERVIDSAILDAIISTYIRLGSSGLKKAWSVYTMYQDLGAKPTQRTFNYLFSGCAIQSPRVERPEKQGARSPESLKKEFAMYLISEMAHQHSPPVHPNTSTYESLIVTCLNHASRLLPEKFFEPPVPMPYPALRAPRHTRRPPALPSNTANPRKRDPEKESLDHAFEYLYEMVYLGGYRPRQWLLRKMLECCIGRDDERAGWLMGEMERWGYSEDMKLEKELAMGFWRRVPVDTTDLRGGMYMGTAQGWGWVRCGRRSRKEGGEWKNI